MLTARPTLLRALRTQTEKIGLRSFSTPAKQSEDEEKGVNPVHELREKMTKMNPAMVFGLPDSALPAPVLPKNVKELARLDQADTRFRTKMNGEPRTVMIRQLEKSSRQAPLNPESRWIIAFNEDGTTAEKWNNSLMGWVSNADPYQCDPPLHFSNAAEAVYFAKKRGWNYLVARPILRTIRDDDAQYQDNFLPQKVALRVEEEGTRCPEWERKSAGTSHYFRPLKYHGDGTVPQHGPNAKQPIAAHVEGYYKLR